MRFNTSISLFSLFICFSLFSIEPPSNKVLFTRIFKTNSWMSRESKSGPGSTLERTFNIRFALPYLFERMGFKTMLDMPCGDFNWMKDTKLDFLDLYIGADIVESLILQNNSRYANENRFFLCLDMTQDPLPKVDVIFCRDCLQHLSNADICKAINNFKRSGSNFLLVSNHVEIDENRDLDQEELHSVLRFRQVNLQLPPYNLPDPIITLYEGGEEKYLSLWNLNEIPYLPEN